MRLHFVRANNVGSLLIRAFEGGEASHVGIVDDDHVIDATLHNGVARRPLDEFMRDRTLIDTVDLPLPMEAAAALWLSQQIGKPYDWTAIVGFVGWRDASHSSRWYCSELVAGAMAAGGVTLADRSARVGVRLLREVARARQPQVVWSGA